MQTISELKTAVDDGFSTIAVRLMDIDAKASDGFTSMRVALEQSDESVRKEIKELHEALKASEQKLAKQLDKATLTNVEVVEGVEAELTALSSRLKIIDLLEPLCGAVDDMKKDLEKNSKDAKDDQTALRTVLSDAVNTVQVMSVKMDVLQAQVSELGLKFAKHSDAVIELIRSSEVATELAVKEAVKEASDSFEAALEHTLREAAAGSDASIQAALLGMSGELLKALGDLQEKDDKGKDEVEKHIECFYLS